MASYDVASTIDQSLPLSALRMPVKEAKLRKSAACVSGSSNVRCTRSKSLFASVLARPGCGGAS